MGAAYGLILPVLNTCTGTDIDSHRGRGAEGTAFIVGKISGPGGIGRQGRIHLPQTQLMVFDIPDGGGHENKDILFASFVGDNAIQ